MGSGTTGEIRIRDPFEFGKVVVLMGGLSAEREISLQSGQAVLDALLRRHVSAYPLDTGQADYMVQLSAGGFSRAFIALHGRGGEDGVIQGALETQGLAYTGSRVLGSALAMDKVRTKYLWRGAGLPTPPFAVLDSVADISAAVQLLGFPMIVKPPCEGSSIGMSKVENGQQLETALRQALKYDRTVLAERWIDGAEYTAAVLNTTVLPLICLETPRAFYDYEAKYHATSTQYRCPCGLATHDEEAFQELALRGFRAVGASGWGRVDFMVDGEGAPWLIEVNTVPGMTDHSLVPMAAYHAGIGFDELVWRILDASVGNNRPEQGKPG